MELVIQPIILIQILDFKLRPRTSQPAFTSSKLTKETLEQGVKFV